MVPPEPPGTPPPHERRHGRRHHPHHLARPHGRFPLLRPRAGGPGRLVFYGEFRPHHPDVRDRRRRRYLASHPLGLRQDGFRSE